MASSNGSTSVVGRQDVQTVADKLSAVLASLPTDTLLSMLQAPTGRRGYGVRVLWNAYVACFLLNTASMSAALRRIEDDPRLAEIVGGIPTKFALSRFIKKLKGHTDLLERCLEKVVQTLQGFLPDLGETVAIDSTDIKAWSGAHPTDPDAALAAKKGNDGHKKWWFGFKAHIACDARYELPLAVHVTPANASDQKQIRPSMDRLVEAGFLPKYILADAGYDSAENYRTIVDDFGAIPIIKINRRGRQKEDWYAPHRTAAYVAAQARGLQLRREAGIKRDSQEWMDRYAERSGAERVFSRLKEFRRLNRLTMRGLAKATVHCVVSVLTLLALTLVALNAGMAGGMRKSAF